MGARWRLLLKPSLADFLFLSMLAWLLLAGEQGGHKLLLDGDTGWHIRTGEYILDHGKVPSQDLFSFSRPGAPWYAWEWLADVVYALLFRAWGLKGVVLLGGVQIALFAALLFRYIMWRGANGLVAMAVGMLAVGASTLHYLARPHLYTLVLLVASLWLLERDRRRPTRAVWWLIPLTGLWTNLHGGFLALIACLGVLAAASALESVWLGVRDPRQWIGSRRYLLLTIGCAAATLANPYGWNLHRHLAEYLRSDWIRGAIQEFQSPSFRHENILQYEVLLFAGLLAAASLLRRRQVTEAAWILFWAHQSLASVRHVPIYVAVAAPLVASEVTSWCEQAFARLDRRSVLSILNRIGADIGAGFRWASLWPAVVVLGFLWVDYPIRWPRDFPEVMFPIPMIERHKEEITSLRLLTSDQWADYLLYRFYPHQKVYIDGRSDFYGSRLGEEYLRVWHGRHDWERILERNGFELALIPAEWPLGSLLKQDPRWRLLDDDGKALLFKRLKANEQAAGQLSKNLPAGSKKPPGD